MLGLYRDNRKENGNYYGEIVTARRIRGVRVWSLGFEGSGFELVC